MNCVFLRSLAHSHPLLFPPLCLRAREFPFKHRTLMENLVYTNSLQPTINRICNYNSRPHILHTYILYTTKYVYVIYDGIFWVFIAYTIIALAPSLSPPQTDSIFLEFSSCPFFRKTIFQTAQTNDLSDDNFFESLYKYIFFSILRLAETNA